MKQLTDAEQKMYEWQYGMLGSFFNGLFDLISKADRLHTEKLRLAYPEYVEAVNRYQHESGYWEKVREKIQKKFREE